MKSALWQRVGTVLLLLAATGLVGCVGNPMAPLPPIGPGDQVPVSGSSDPPVLTVSADGSAGFEAMPAESLLDAEVTLLAQVASVDSGSIVPGALLTRQNIDGAKGGTVRCGRFHIDFAPGAFKGTATIQMAAPDSTVMLCDLSISPASANQFDAPVVLTLDARNPNLSTATLTIYWFDPATSRWVDMKSSRVIGTDQVTQQLTHFSRYCGGKAGW